MTDPCTAIFDLVTSDTYNAISVQVEIVIHMC